MRTGLALPTFGTDASAEGVVGVARSARGAGVRLPLDGGPGSRPHFAQRAVLARRAAGWLPVAMPLPYLTGMWATVLQQAEDAGRDPSTLRMALRVNPALTAQKADPERIPEAGTLEQYIDYARAAAEAGVHELFVDLGQSPLGREERADLTVRFGRQDHRAGTSPTPRIATRQIIAEATKGEPWAASHKHKRRPTGSEWWRPLPA